MKEKDVQRRLTTILAADVVGYSRLMEDDEAGTLAALKVHRKEIIDPKAEQYSGRIIKLMGDGMLLEFASVVDAVSFAVELQCAVRKRNVEEREARRITYRIGINIGDIIDEGDDIYGDGVNVAARLEALAETGGICISRPVHTQVADKLDLHFDDLGEQKVKNITKPVMVYRVALDDKAETLVTPIVVAPVSPGRFRSAVFAAGVALVVFAFGGILWWQPWSPELDRASVEKLAFPLPDKPSVAVLPFENLSGDAAQNYWIDGTTEAVITALSKTKNLFVIARNSTFTHKGLRVETRDVAEEFGVRYVLTGSIQRAAGRVRVNAQLVDALAGYHVWADQFDHSFDDVFALQDNLTREVVTALEVKLTEGEQARIWRRQTESREAYEVFRKALDLYRRRTKEDNQEARRLFTEAAAIDASFADATCSVGFTYVRAGLNGWERPRGEAFAKARELAERAIALDPDYAHAYALIGSVATWEGDIDTAIIQLEKSLELEPNYSANVAAYAQALVFAGRGSEAAEKIELAMRLSPYYPNWYLLVAGSAYRLMGHADQALEAYEKRVKRAPRSVFAKLWLAGLYLKLERRADAEALMAQVVQKADWLNSKVVASWLLYQDAAQSETILESLRQAGLPE